MRTRIGSRRWCLATIAILAVTAHARDGGAIPSRGGDWPQLWGPSHNGAAAATKPLFSGTALRARERWRRPIGSGFSGISVSGGRGYTAFSDRGRDHATAFELESGRELWRADLGETYRGHDGSKDGPISTPSVERGRVFLVGPHGTAFALDTATGRVLWKHDLKTEYEAPPPQYGFATSPLVVGDRVIVQAGGDKKHNMVAFEAATGRLVWSAQHASATGYASPIRASIDGREQVIVVAGDKILGVDPRDGALVWSHALPMEQERSRPPLVLPDGRVLVPSWNESIMFRVARQGDAFAVTELWRSPRLKASYSPTVFHRGHLFGFNGGYLVCVDADDGDVVWRQRVYSGSLILVDGHLLILGDSSGDLRVAEASPEAYREKLKVPVFNAGATSSTTPSWAAGRVLLRNVEEIVALEIVGGGGA